MDKKELSDWLVGMMFWIIVILFGMLLFANLSCKGTYEVNKKYEYNNRK